MIYECEQCEAVLEPGIMACSRCGQPFDEPVPSDAMTDAMPDAAPGESAEAVTAPARPRRRSRLPRIGLGLAASVLLLGAGWRLEVHLERKPAPAVKTIPTLPTDTVAHPAYPAAMTALVGQLRATGVGAQWPAFGSRDVLVITPPALLGGKPALWDREMSLRLAQGVYGNFAQTRFEAGFSGTDATTCFVLVSSPAGQVAAVDLMGNLE